MIEELITQIEKDITYFKGLEMYQLASKFERDLIGLQRLKHLLELKNNNTTELKTSEGE